MRINWSKALGDGLKFGFHPQRWLQLLVVDVFFLSVIFSFVYLNLSDIFYLFSSLSTGADRFLVMSLLSYIWIPVVFFILWFIVRIWMNGSIVYQSWKTKGSEIGKSWRYACRKYPSMLFAIVIITLLATLFSMIPYIGWMLSIIISWIFFFTVQAIIIRNTGFYDGLVDSYEIFRKNPFEVIVIWLITAIISVVIFSIFALPMASLLFVNVLYLTETAGIASLFLLLKEQMVFFVISGLILLIGISVATAFTLKAQVEFYLQLKKRFRVF